MALLDNPAGRLHDLLSEFRGLSEDGQSYKSTWASVFQVDESSPEFAIAMSRLAGLPAAIYDSTLRERRNLIASVHFWVADWSLPTTLWGVNIAAAASAGIISDAALHALESHSELLSATASEGFVPAAAERDDLRASVWEALEAARAADDLPPELQRIVVARLYDLLVALDTFRIGGPDAVQAALQRWSLPSPAEAEGHPVLARFRKVSIAAWALFLSIDPALESVDALDKLVKMLPSGG